ncbi:MAG: TIGR01212 family radical SAM protein [Candidatus Omnitrophota bacterium]
MRYYSFSNYLKDRYGTKVWRVSLSAGFSCPNKDRPGGGGGCIFCNEAGFSRYAASALSLAEQIEKSIKEIRDKKKAAKFIAYFQNATNTYGDLEALKTAYDVITGYPEIVALYISTRPDCVDESKLDLIASYTRRYEVWIEYGVQTAHDRTLKIINRGHTFAESADAVKKTVSKGIKAAAHIILGLPGENRQDMIATAREISKLPVSGIKLHTLHVMLNTELEKMYRAGGIKILEMEEYIGLACDFLENTRKDCVIFRLASDARDELLIAPKWMNDKFSVINGIENELEARGTAQGYSLREGHAKE